MKAISIYALTREQDMNCLQKMERQLSDRSYFLENERMGAKQYESPG